MAFMPRRDSAARCDEEADSGPSQRESAGIAVEQCRAWLDWAAAQIDACLACSSADTDRLLASLGELFGPMQVWSATVAPPDNEIFSQKMSDLIVAVQSHDRASQRFTHVAESLRLLHGQLGDAVRAESAESWRTLREQQYRTFSMAEERLLFARMVAAEGDCCNHDVAMNLEDTIEIFTEHAFDEPA
jgi:hypothetical protein